MLEEVNTTKFKKDSKKLRKQNKDASKLSAVIEKLKNEQSLEEKYKDHSLQGEYEGSRECHIEPDWLLVHRMDKSESKLYLLRTGSHSILFKESYHSIIRELNEKILCD